MTDFPKVFGRQVSGHSEAPVGTAALKPIEIWRRMPDENVTSLAQAFRNVSLFWLASKTLSLGLNVGTGWSRTQESCHRRGLVTFANHLLGDKIVCSVSTVEFCRVKYFLMLKAKSFSFPVDEGLAKPTQVLGTEPCNVALCWLKWSGYNHDLKIQPHMPGYSFQDALILQWFWRFSAIPRGLMLLWPNLHCQHRSLPEEYDCQWIQMAKPWQKSKYFSKYT